MIKKKSVLSRIFLLLITILVASLNPISYTYAKPQTPNNKWKHSPLGKPKPLKFKKSYKNYELKFTDLPKDHKDYEIYAWAVDNGIIKNFRGNINPDKISTIDDLTDILYYFVTGYRPISYKDITSQYKEMLEDNLIDEISINPKNDNFVKLMLIRLDNERLPGIFEYRYAQMFPNNEIFEGLFRKLYYNGNRKVNGYIFMSFLYSIDISSTIRKYYNAIDASEATDIVDTFKSLTPKYISSFPNYKKISKTYGEDKLYLYSDEYYYVNSTIIAGYGSGVRAGLIDNDMYKDKDAIIRFIKRNYTKGDIIRAIYIFSRNYRTIGIDIRQNASGLRIKKQ